MADTDPTPGIAEPHQTTVDGIPRGVGQGLFTMDEADVLVDRIRAHVSALPVSAERAAPAAVSGRASNTLPHSPALPSVSPAGPPRPATVLLNRHPDAAGLTVTAQPSLTGAVVIAVRGEVDWITGPLLRDALLTQLRHTGPPLVIDLTEVDFLGAAGLTALVTVRDTAVAAGIRVRLVTHTRVVLLPLTVTGLDRLFDIYPDLAGALPVLGAGQDG